MNIVSSLVSEHFKECLLFIAFVYEYKADMHSVNAESIKCKLSEIDVSSHCVFQGTRPVWAQAVRLGPAPFPGWRS